MLGLDCSQRKSNGYHEEAHCCVKRLKRKFAVCMAIIILAVGHFVHDAADLGDLFAKTKIVENFDAVAPD